MTPQPFVATVVTLFPEMFPGPLGCSIPGRSLEKGLWRLETVPIRDFGIGKYRQVDDTPYGGGTGMVMRPDVIDSALRKSLEYYTKDPAIIYLSPKGVPLRQERLREFLNMTPHGMIFLCGRYEGIDQRLIDCWSQRPNWHEVSIGDYVLSGGELGAMVILDALIRLIPGNLIKEDATTIETFEQNLLEFPHYTKPQKWNDIEVPFVLRSGHHEDILKWRSEQAKQETQCKRPDLWQAHIKNE